MPIETVPVIPADGSVLEGEPEVFNLRVEGPLRRNDDLVLRARRMLQAKGSPEMLESFDWAIQNDALIRID